MRTEPVQELNSNGELSPQPKPIRAKSAGRATWEDYLLGKKTKAVRFLEKLRKGPVPVLDERTRTRLVAEATSKKDGMERLLDLAQASIHSNPTIRATALDLAVAGLEHAGIELPTTSTSPYAYAHRVEMWLGGIKKKPLKTEQLRILLLLIHVGVSRYFLDHESAFELLSKALSAPKTKKATQHSPASGIIRSPLEVLILAEPTPAALATLLAYEAAIAGERRKLGAQLQAQAADLAQLRNQVAELSSAIQEARSEIHQLQQERQLAGSEIEALRKQIVDVHDDYKYKLFELRGRIRGVLGGQMTQWLQTALDASYADPPRAGAIQERLEDALSMIAKEMEWLQPSD